MDNESNTKDPVASNIATTSNSASPEIAKEPSQSIAAVAAKPAPEATSSSSSQSSEAGTEQSARPVPERRPSRGGKVPVEEIAAGIASSGKQMSQKLRELLMGTVALRIVDRSRAFVFDPAAGGFSMREAAGQEARATGGDCVIEMNENALQRMWNGDLNPQIAMLSDKVTISGKAELAVYFFNLVSPK